MWCPECNERIDEERIFMMATAVGAEPFEDVEFQCLECDAELTAHVDFPMDDMPEVRLVG